MTEFAVIILLVLVIAGQSWIMWKREREHGEELGRLCDRIMAKHYAEFVQGEVARKQADALTAEEIYEQNRERGIPV